MRIIKFAAILAGWIGFVGMFMDMVWVSGGNHMTVGVFCYFMFAAALGLVAVPNFWEITA